ncbi:hypothetical protein L3X38_025356 [Prunus dulcis]|uniref:Uncharacterized protein n=1 Tax=Prunus dulcis TaxID=3755 RepID=A0AAD4W1P0_PRUDU|nr:hypothetical protein L3X38_025356 [Prunus dulcis]
MVVGGERNRPAKNREKSTNLRRQGGGDGREVAEVAAEREAGKEENQKWGRRRPRVVSADLFDFARRIIKCVAQNSINESCATTYPSRKMA